MGTNSSPTLNAQRHTSGTRLPHASALGMLGSSLRELYHNAAMLPVRDYVQETSTDQEALSKGQLDLLLPDCTS